MLITSCKDCAERRVGCHSECERYLKQKSESEATRKNAHKVCAIDDFFRCAERGKRMKRRVRRGKN